MSSPGGWIFSSKKSKKYNVSPQKVDIFHIKVDIFQSLNYYPPWNEQQTQAPENGCLEYFSFPFVFFSFFSGLLIFREGTIIHSLF